MLTFSVLFFKVFPCCGSTFKEQNKGEKHRKLRWSIVGKIVDTKLNKTAYAEGTADQNKNGSLVSSLDSHLLSKMAADDCFLSRKTSRIQSRLVELILSGMRKDIGRH